MVVKAEVEANYKVEQHQESVTKEMKKMIANGAARWSVPAGWKNRG
jgi:hypothetical protein